jgi:phosphotransferase system HPr-like phosphotransfer protein
MSVKDAIFTGSREQVIPEEAFLPLLEEGARGLLALRGKIASGVEREWSRRFISRILKEVHSLRSLLMDYDAQENRSFSYLVELVAGIRCFGTVIYILKHLRARFLRSPLHDSLSWQEEFEQEQIATITFCANTLRGLFTELLAECELLGIDPPDPEPEEEEDQEAGAAVRQHLPHNLDEEEMHGEMDMVAQVATDFLRVADLSETLDPGRLTTYPALRAYVLGRLDEEQARTFESQVHTIQSKYDTYVQYTLSEAQDSDLRRLRSVISLSLHLYEATTHLIHFYERHENDIRSETTKARIARVVDKFAVLDRAVNYAFHTAGRFIMEGSSICQRLVPRYTSIRELHFVIPPDVRLHIRPAALIAAIVNHHGTPVTMKMGGGECDAGSVTDVIFLAGSNYDCTEVSFRGDERPLGDIQVLFEVGLYDEKHQEVKARLPYL